MRRPFLAVEKGNLKCTQHTNQYNPSLVFPVGDGFGLFVCFGKFEEMPWPPWVAWENPEEKMSAHRRNNDVAKAHAHTIAAVLDQEDHHLNQ